MRIANLTVTLALFAAAMPSVVAAQSDDYRYSAPRSATVSTAGVRQVRVEAGAGFLRIEGKAGLTEIRATGTAHASSQEILERIKLTVVKNGDIITVKTEFPDEDCGWRDSCSRALDLTVELPASMAMDVSDGSGELEIQNVGALEVNDGSGGIHLKDIRGDVRISDGSGEIVARNITGNLSIDTDGSGGIEAYDVTGSFIVKNDGSGEIHASGVGRDFEVDRKGSGSISYSDVKGRVDIPERKSRRRYYQ
jgi:hypothetical protein